MTLIIKELITSTSRADRLFAIALLKELGLLGTRCYKLSDNQEHLDILNNLAKVIKKYEKLEGTIQKKVE